MGHEHNKEKPIIKAASACVWRGDDVLLIQRASSLGKGRWSLPGGKVEDSESLLQAAHRELREETAVTAELIHHLSDFTVEAPDVTYVISCFTGLYLKGEAKAGSDAAAVTWSHWQTIGQFNLAPHIEAAVAHARKLTSV
jgi:8-oxo-dGTP diphosphatase